MGPKRPRNSAKRSRGGPRPDPLAPRGGHRPGRHGGRGDVPAPPPDAALRSRRRIGSVPRIAHTSRFGPRPTPRDGTSGKHHEASGPGWAARLPLANDTPEVRRPRRGVTVGAVTWVGQRSRRGGCGRRWGRGGDSLAGPCGQAARDPVDSAVNIPLRRPLRCGNSIHGVWTTETLAHSPAETGSPARAEFAAHSTRPAAAICTAIGRCRASGPKTVPRPPTVAV